MGDGKSSLCCEGMTRKVFLISFCTSLFFYMAGLSLYVIPIFRQWRMFFIIYTWYFIHDTLGWSLKNIYQCLKANGSVRVSPCEGLCGSSGIVQISLKTKNTPELSMLVTFDVNCLGNKPYPAVEVLFSKQFLLYYPSSYGLNMKSSGAKKMWKNWPPYCIT